MALPPMENERNLHQDGPLDEGNTDSRADSGSTTGSLDDAIPDQASLNVIDGDQEHPSPTDTNAASAAAAERPDAHPSETHARTPVTRPYGAARSSTQLASSASESSRKSLRLYLAALSASQQVTPLAGSKPCAMMSPAVESPTGM